MARLVEKGTRHGADVTRCWSSRCAVDCGSSQTQTLSDLRRTCTQWGTDRSPVREELCQEVEHTQGAAEFRHIGRDRQGSDGSHFAEVRGDAVSAGHMPKKLDGCLFQVAFGWVEDDVCTARASLTAVSVASCSAAVEPKTGMSSMNTSTFGMESRRSDIRCWKISRAPVMPKGRRL